MTDCNAAGQGNCDGIAEAELDRLVGKRVIHTVPQGTGVARLSEVSDTVQDCARADTQLAAMINEKNDE